MLRIRRRFAAACTSLLAAACVLVTRPGTLRAQESLLPSTSWGFSGVISEWHFAKPIATSGGGIADVAQAAAPFQVRATIAERFTFDVTGAYASAAIHTQSTKGDGETEDNIVLLNGPTDMRVRLSGPLVGDNLLFTAGVNLPTGISHLNNDQTNVLQAVGAPALRMPVSSYGVGAGGTFGIVGATERAGWAIALGGSLEKRTEYTPVSLVFSGTSSDMRLTPGMAMHFTLGLDHTVGESRLSVVLLDDNFSADKIVLASGGATTGTSQYQLGPQFGGLARLDFGGGAWSEGAVAVSARHRTEFKDASGAPVEGSSGSYYEGSLGGVLGGAGRAGLVIGVDGRWHSGLPFTSTLVGAAVTAVGGTIGVQFPRGVRFTVHPQYGTFDTGVTNTTGVGATIALSIFARRATP
jgi:hypothetical protein